MTRGRLLFPLLAELAQLDTHATELADGYDPVWRTVKTTYQNGERVRGQVYKTPTLRVRCQVEPAQEAAQQRAPAGNVPDSRMVLVFHFADLERAGLIDPDGHALLRVDDKLVAMHTTAGVLVKRLAPSLFATEVQDGGLGLGGRRNLAMVTFEDRPQGAT